MNISWVLILGILSIFVILHGLLAVTVFLNARAHRDRAVLLWTLLTTFLGALPALIYYIQRKPYEIHHKICDQCRVVVTQGDSVCPHCGNRHFLRDFATDEQEHYRRRAKSWFTTWIIALASWILIVIVFWIIVGATSNLGTPQESASYGHSSIVEVPPPDSVLY